MLRVASCATNRLLLPHLRIGLPGNRPACSAGASVSCNNRPQSGPAGHSSDTFYPLLGSSWFHLDAVRRRIRRSLDLMTGRVRPWVYAWVLTMLVTADSSATGADRFSKVMACMAVCLKVLSFSNILLSVRDGSWSSASRSFDDLHTWMICDLISASTLLNPHPSAIFFTRA